MAMMTLNDLEHSIIYVAMPPFLGYKKPSLWVRYDGKMIKLATFVDDEKAELFMDYFEAKGFPVDAYDFDFEEGNKQ